MEDVKIVDLYWQRDETAIAATKEKYGAYLRRIAFNIAAQFSDSEECENDTYLAAWNSIPPHKPTVLQTYLGKITRRIAIDRYRKNTSAKRGGSEVELSIDELTECLPFLSKVEHKVELRQLSDTINDFLRMLSLEKRRAFLLRYWYSLSIKEISDLLGFSQPKTVNLLSRTRKELKKHLEKEELFHG